MTEQWHGSRRPPANLHSEKYVNMQLGSNVIKPEDATCASAGELRCFDLDLALFDGIFEYRHWSQEPTQGSKVCRRYHRHVRL